MKSSQVKKAAAFALAAWFLTAASFGGASRVFAAVSPKPAIVLAVNINTASASELEKLHGIGPALAQRIADHRAQFGPFKNPDDLSAVSGVGKAKIEKIKAQITI